MLSILRLTIYASECMYLVIDSCNPITVNRCQSLPVQLIVEQNMFFFCTSRNNITALYMDLHKEPEI